MVSVNYFHIISSADIWFNNINRFHPGIKYLFLFTVPLNPGISYREGINTVLNRRTEKAQKQFFS